MQNNAGNNSSILGDDNIMTGEDNIDDVNDSEVESKQEQEEIEINESMTAPLGDFQTDI